MQKGIRNIGIMRIYWLKVFTLCAPTNPSSKNRMDVSTTATVTKKYDPPDFDAKTMASETIVVGIESEIDFDKRYCQGCNGVTTSAELVPACFSNSTITPTKINPIIDGSEKISSTIILLGISSRYTSPMYRAPIPRATGKIPYLSRRIISHFSKLKNVLNVQLALCCFLFYPFTFKLFPVVLRKTSSKLSSHEWID